MKSLLESRPARVAVAAVATLGLSASLGTGVAAAAKPAAAEERTVDAGAQADDKRSTFSSQGRKVG